MTNRNIYELLSQGERVTLECKKKDSDFKITIVPNYCQATFL